MSHIYRNFINGEWVESLSGKRFEKRNPADTREVVGEFPDSSADDAKVAVEAAKSAFPKWRQMPAPRRAEILFRASEKLLQSKDAFARDMTREMGKVLKEAGGDVQEAIDMGYYIAGEGRRLHGHTTPSELPGKYMMSVRIPLGVAALITPWNFPMAIPSWKTLPALVAGNTVVLKPSPEAPLSAVHYVQTLHEAGVPPGVLNLVIGTGKEAGEHLVTSPDVSVLSFTGSTETGRVINQMAAGSFKRVSLEMGGKNAIIVLDDADLDLALEGAVWGGFGTSGQRCTAASRVILHEKIYDVFASRFVAQARALRPGNGLDPKTDLGPIVSRSQLERVERFVQIGKEEGAALLCGGERLEQNDLKHGYFLSPAVFGDVDRNMRIAREEIFGPVVSLLRVNSFEDAVSVCNDTGYGLSSSIYTRDVNRAFQAMRDLYTGITYINAPTIGAEVHLPFGGTKATGNGHREGGPTVLDLYTEWKTIYVDFSGRLQKAQIDNE